MPCFISLSFLEGRTPHIGHKPLTQRDLGWPGFLWFCGGRVNMSPPRARMKTDGIESPIALTSPGFFPRTE